MARLDPNVLAHLEWLGFVQPIGLVVSAPALVRAGAVLDRSDIDGQRRLRECVAGDPARLTDFETFARHVLDWSFSSKGYAGGAGGPIPPELMVALPDHGETLRPDYAVRERDPRDGRPAWQLLVRTVPESLGFDEREPGGLDATAHGRMERLLRETGVPAGLLVNGRALRLISAPRGESSGYLDFQVEQMAQTAGRPIVSALRLLLNERRLLAVPREQRLAALLEDSRRFQNEVSEKLSEQVLHALYELLRGFQAAHDASRGELLRKPLGDDPDEVYRALLTVILRLVFLLYAEEREMLPAEATFLRFYSVAGLHERLREQAARFPDTMDQRFGAWAQLLALFRLVHDGTGPGDPIQLPARHGGLFDPDRFPFLEARDGDGSRQIHERIEPPLVTDRTVYRALEKLLMLDGERISYRALDVEQIGSVYETMMGFRLHTTTGTSLAIRPAKKRGAPSMVDLDALLEVETSERAKWLKEHTDRTLAARMSTAVRDAQSREDLHSALLSVADPAASPDLVPAGAMALQPSEERRRSGSHYTPRTLTEPIVRDTLAPILDRLRADDRTPPLPDQILDLKVCDPAMGSGAFLVEACRQLGDALVESWGAHGGRPEIPADEDEVILARRLVAQRCLYGVDRNPVAVDLAKMSLWLVTLAREHALTFVDHALRYGDSLVGLSRRQIESFHWETKAVGFEAIRIGEHLDRVRALRAQIRAAGDEVSDFALRDLWD
ncbi:MAG: type IIL restriction-modification enzyme MmeI [Thermoleophilia bacterium]